MTARATPPGKLRWTGTAHPGILHAQNATPPAAYKVPPCALKTDGLTLPAGIATSALAVLTGLASAG